MDILDDLRQQRIVLMTKAEHLTVKCKQSRSHIERIELIFQLTDIRMQIGNTQCRITELLESKLRGLKSDFMITSMPNDSRMARILNRK